MTTLWQLKLCEWLHNVFLDYNHKDHSIDTLQRSLDLLNYLVNEKKIHQFLLPHPSPPFSFFFFPLSTRAPNKIEIDFKNKGIFREISHKPINANQSSHFSQYSSYQLNLCIFQFPKQWCVKNKSAEILKGKNHWCLLSFTALGLTHSSQHVKQYNLFLIYPS